MKFIPRASRLQNNSGWLHMVTKREKRQDIDRSYLYKLWNTKLEYCILIHHLRIMNNMESVSQNNIQNHYKYWILKNNSTCCYNYLAVGDVSSDGILTHMIWSCSIHNFPQTLVIGNKALELIIVQILGCFFQQRSKEEYFWVIWPIWGSYIVSQSNVLLLWLLILKLY